MTAILMYLFQNSNYFFNYYTKSLRRCHTLYMYKLFRLLGNIKRGRSINYVPHS